MAVEGLSAPFVRWNRAVWDPLGPAASERGGGKAVFRAGFGQKGRWGAVAAAVIAAAAAAAAGKWGNSVGADCRKF